MKKKWKYDKRIVLFRTMSIYPVITWISVVCFLFSCNNDENHKHIPTNKPVDLDGLAQPTNQTVFSDVKTILPKKRTIAPILTATGVITYNPNLLNNISARFTGRIEKLYVRFNFEPVSKGQRIMDIYSPEILTAQQNLIYLLNDSSADSTLINSSRNKLRLLGLTSGQLNQIENGKLPINPLPLYSPYNGHIHDIGISNANTTPSSMSTGMGAGMNNSKTSTTDTQIENLPSSQTSALSIKEGMYIQNGQAIFSVYSTDQVWAVLNIFPEDAPLVKIGDKVSITAETNPNHTINSTINYIEPVIGKNASSEKARVYLANEEAHHLKIGTLVSAKINTDNIEGWWLPRTAVVNLGRNQIVFQKIDNHFISKNVMVGLVVDSLVQIISGLKGDETVASNAQFMVDSESFIQTENDEHK